jgi:tricorn protease-like protein
MPAFMPLATGARLGPYEILAPIGAGGMGEVYKARDNRLDRHVAIKILAAHIAGDPGVDFRLSPDNKKLAFSRTIQQFQAPDVWVRDLEGGSDTRVTTNPLTEAAPQWSRTGDELVFRANRQAANMELFRTRPESGAQSVRIWSVEENRRAYGGRPGNALLTDWSLDGKYVVVHQTGGATGYDVWALPLEGERKPIPIANGSGNEILGAVSPDGRWIAYTSDESGRYEIYVQPFPNRAAGRKHTVSTGGGTQPRWRADGGELFYLRDDMLMSVSIETTPSFSLGTVKPLFKAPLPITMNPYRMDYDASAKGDRFVMKVPVPGAPPPSITVVLNWPSTVGK